VIFVNVSTDEQKLSTSKNCYRHRCSIFIAVGKDEATTLPRVSATDANVVLIAIGDLPPFRHVQRTIAIINQSVTANLVHMQRHVEVAAVALGNAGYNV
jgi:hypothetical protein